MGALAAYRRVLGNPRLARLMAGEFISSIGDWLYLVALLIVVYEESGDPVILGIVGAGRLLPFLLLAVPAGIAADRFDRRKIMLATDIVRGLLQLVLAALVIVAAPTMAIVVVAIVAACASAFFGPAIGAYLPSLVEDETDLGPANSVWATLDNLAFFVGPAVAGLLIATGGLAIAFLLNAVSFAVVAVVLLGLPSRRPAVEAAPSSDDAGATEAATGSWATIAAKIPGVVVLDAATSFVGAGLGVLTVIIADETLRAGPEVTGYLNAATGIGGILAGFLAGWLVLRRLDASILGAALVGLVSIAALAFATEVLPALLAIAVVTGALLILDIVNATVLQRAVPDAERGRAMGVLQITSSLAMIAGAFILPVIAVSSVRDALVLSGVLGTGVAILAVVLLRPTGALGRPSVSDRRIDLLRESVFGGLPPARLEAAARALQPVAVKAGEPVILQGGEADRFYFIDRGRYRVSQRTAAGDEVELKTMSPGEVFGEIGLLTSRPRTATVTSVEDGQLFALDRDAFLALVSAGPGLSTRLLDLHRGSTAVTGARP